MMLTHLKGVGVKRFRDVLKDRRGVTAIAFAVSSTVFIATTGFGIETGTWYLEKRHGQNVADAAALAGVFALLQTTPGDPVAAGTTIATANGYQLSEITMTAGTYNGGAAFCCATPRRAGYHKGTRA